MVGDVGGGVEGGVVEADEVAVLGRRHVGLDEVGALVDGAHVRRRRLLGELAVRPPVRDVERPRRLQRRLRRPHRSSSTDQRPRRRDAAAARRAPDKHHHRHPCTQRNTR